MKEPTTVQARLWTRNFILLSASNLLMFSAFYFLIPILPVYIVEELKGNKAQVGMALASFTLAALLVRPLTGVTIDGIGRRIIFLVSLMVFSLVFNLYVMASSLLFLVLLRFFHGLSWGITSTTGGTVVVDIIPPSRRGEGISVYGLSFTLAMAVGPMIGMIIWQQKHYDLVFISGAVLSLMGWILAVMVNYPLFIPVNNGKIIWKKLLEYKAIPVSINLLLLNITYGGIISFVAIYAKEIGVSKPGMFFVLYAVGVASSRMWAGKIFDHQGPRNLITLGALIMASGFAFFGLWKTVPGFFAASLLLGLGGGVMMPTFQAMANNLVQSNRRGVANSTLFTALDLGIGLGMVLTGLVSEKIGLDHTFLIDSFICLLALAFFYIWIFPHYLRHRILSS